MNSSYSVKEKTFDIKSINLNFVSGRMLFILLGIGLFVFIAYWIYKYYIYPRHSIDYVTNKEFAQPITNKSVNIILFYTEWCPHSQKALKIWNEYEQKNRGKIINGYSVKYIKYDCDKNESKADEYNIQGYPTIKLVKENGEIIEFDAKPEKETLDEFLNTTLN